MEQKQTKKEVQKKEQKGGQKKNQKNKKKGMKKNEKIVIAILLIITIALIVVACVRNSDSSEEETTETSSSSTSEEEETTEEKYVTTLSDGTKLNTSEKLNEDKEIDGIEVTDIQLTESNNQTQLLATLTNTSGETAGKFTVTINLLDEDGETLVQLKAYIPELEDGESTQLNTSSGLDYSNAYDFTITK